MVQLPVNPDLPDVDDHIVRSEARFEILDGRVYPVAPADEPHGESHAALAAIVHAHRAAGYSLAVDMLTRTSQIDDIAPDVSVYPSARTATGGRRLEELAFEIASTESLSHAGKKAAKLVERGVRRVFAIDLDRGRVVEWSRDLADWSILNLRDRIIDVAFAIPLPIDALVDAARSDDAVVRAFRLRRHPEFVAERVEGRIDEARRAVVELLARRGMSPTESEHAMLVAQADLDTLRRWIVGAVACVTVADLFAT